MRTYEDCIGSTELIDWLHKSLQKNVNFGPDVTRDQTIQLLKKLYRYGGSGSPILNLTRIFLGIVAKTHMHSSVAMEYFTIKHITFFLLFIKTFFLTSICLP